MSSLIAPKNVCVVAAHVAAPANAREAAPADRHAHSPAFSAAADGDGADALLAVRARLEEVVRTGEGRLLPAPPSLLLAAFDDCDRGVRAASNMLERVRELKQPNGEPHPLRIGLHYGVGNGADSGGEGVALARRLADLAQPEQALATGTVVMLLSPQARRIASSQAVRSPATDRLGWPVFAIGQRVAGLMTVIAPGARLMQRLRLRHQQDVVFVEEHRPVLLLGRELGNDVVIMDPRASRQHARIERSRDGFLLIDTSTNGSFVIEDSGDEQRVHHSTMLLSGVGRIGCGFSVQEIDSDLVFFDLV